MSTTKDAQEEKEDPSVKVTSIRLPIEVYEGISRISKDEDRPVGYMMRVAVTEYVRNRLKGESGGFA